MIRELCRAAGFAVIALFAVVSVAWAGWESDTCGGTENYGETECTLDWCVNETMAYYNCDGLMTAKYDCSDGCDEGQN
jgi:hypothetical protein